MEEIKRRILCLHKHKEAKIRVLLVDKTSAVSTAKIKGCSYHALLTKSCSTNSLTCQLPTFSLTIEPTEWDKQTIESATFERKQAVLWLTIQLRWRRQVWTLKLQSSWVIHRCLKTRSTWSKSSIKKEATLLKTNNPWTKTSKALMSKILIWLCLCHKWVHHSISINLRVHKTSWKTSLERHQKMSSGLITYSFINGASKQVVIDSTSVSSKQTCLMKNQTTSHFFLIQASD